MTDRQSAPALNYLETREGAEEFISDHIERCRRLLLKDGELAPFGVLLTRLEPNGMKRTDALNLVAIPAPPGPNGGWGDVPSKDAFRALLQLSLVLLEGIAIIFTSEVWAAPGSPFDKTLPADNPARKEALLIQYEHVALAEPRVYAIPMLRDAAGKVSLGEVKPVHGAQGRFFNLMGRAGSN